MHNIHNIHWKNKTLFVKLDAFITWNDFDMFHAAGPQLELHKSSRKTCEFFKKVEHL